MQDCRRACVVLGLQPMPVLLLVNPFPTLTATDERPYIFVRSFLYSDIGKISRTPEEKSTTWYSSPVFLGQGEDYCHVQYLTFSSPKARITGS